MNYREDGASGWSSAYVNGPGARSDENSDPRVPRALTDIKTITGLDRNTRYEARVRAYGDGLEYAEDWSPWSGIKSATTRDVPCPTPTPTPTPTTTDTGTPTPTPTPTPHDNRYRDADANSNANPYADAAFGQGTGSHGVRGCCQHTERHDFRRHVGRALRYRGIPVAALGRWWRLDQRTTHSRHRPAPSR